LKIRERLKRKEKEMKITVGYFRELLHQYDNAEISISRFVELLNQKVVSDQQDEWKPVEKETEFDGFYLGYIIKQEVCGAIYKHQRVLQNKIMSGCFMITKC
jgi:hypothetical protein